MNSTPGSSAPSYRSGSDLREKAFPLWERFLIATARSRLKIAPTILAIVFLFPFSTAHAEWFEDTQAIMGTRVHAELWHDDAATAARLLEAVMNEMRRVDQAYSTYREDSDLSRLNREAPTGWATVTPEMIYLLSTSHAASDASGGAFDVTYASVGRYYDYRKGLKPDDETIRRLVEAIDYRHVEIDAPNTRVRYTRPEVYVDLGGIAKGYAVDKAIDILRAAGIEHAAISAGGDSRIVGDRMGQPWTIGVRDPRQDDGVSTLLPLYDTAISTSGDYERYFEKDGIRYHHIIDPRTGRSAGKCWSVTILGPTATITEGLSKSVFVLGAERGIALIDTIPGVDAIVIDSEGRMHYSKNLRPLGEQAAR
jgi:thiamine biosynthesis lipoprotein